VVTHWGAVGPHIEATFVAPRVGIVTEARDEEEEEELLCAGHAVNDEVLHAGEDLARGDHRLDDGGEPWLSEHDVGRSTCSIRSSLDRNADVGTLEGRGIVHPIATHPHEVHL